MTEFLSIEEAATLVGVSSSTIRGWVKCGDFPEPVEGLRGRWRRSDVERYLSAQGRFMETATLPSPDVSEGPGGCGQRSLDGLETRG